MNNGVNDLFIIIATITPFLIFFFGLLFYWIGAFFIFYHLVRFGVGTTPKKVAFVFFTGSIMIFIFVIIFFIQIDMKKLIEELTRVIKI